MFGPEQWIDPSVQQANWQTQQGAIDAAAAADVLGQEFANQRIIEAQQAGVQQQEAQQRIIQEAHFMRMTQEQQMQWQRQQANTRTIAESSADKTSTPTEVTPGSERLLAIQDTRWLTEEELIQLYRALYVEDRLEAFAVGRRAPKPVKTILEHEMERSAQTFPAFAEVSQTHELTSDGLLLFAASAISKVGSQDEYQRIKHIIEHRTDRSYTDIVNNILTD